MLNSLEQYAMPISLGPPGQGEGVVLTHLQRHQLHSQLLEFSTNVLPGTRKPISHTLSDNAPPERHSKRRRIPGTIKGSSAVSPHSLKAVLK